MAITINALRAEILRRAVLLDELGHKEDMKGPQKRRSHLIRGCQIGSRQLRDVLSWIAGEQERDEVDELMEGEADD